MKLSVNGVNSHIQMPKCVLKRFENQNHRFYYYDVEKGIIGSNGHAKTTNTQFGYYSEEVEKYLNDNIEAPFAKVLQFVDNTDFDELGFVISPEFQYNVKSFVYALIARDPSITSKVDEYSIFWHLLSAQDQHNYAAIQGINLAQESGFFDPFIVTFSVNKTKKPFVLPMCGIYSYILHDAIHVNLPVSPQVAITLVEQKCMTELINDDIAAMYAVEEELIVGRLNGLAFETQCNTGWGYVVSPEKTVLEELAVKNRKDREG